MGIIVCCSDHTMTNWIYQGLPFDDPGKYIAFVYLITNKTNGKMYVGKKGFKARKNKKMIESDWRAYTGSSTALNEDIRNGALIEKEMLHLTYSKGEASYLELVEQINRNVLFDDQYYNRFIGCKIHSNHVKKMIRT